MHREMFLSSLMSSYPLSMLILLDLDQSIQMTCTCVDIPNAIYNTRCFPFVGMLQKRLKMLVDLLCPDFIYVTGGRNIR